MASECARRLTKGYGLRERCVSRRRAAPRPLVCDPSLTQNRPLYQWFLKRLHNSHNRIPLVAPYLTHSRSSLLSAQSCPLLQCTNLYSSAVFQNLSHVRHTNGRPSTASKIVAVTLGRHPILRIIETKVATCCRRNELPHTCWRIRSGLLTPLPVAERMPFGSGAQVDRQIEFAKANVGARNQLLSVSRVGRYTLRCPGLANSFCHCMICVSCVRMN